MGLVRLSQWTSRSCPQFADSGLVKPCKLVFAETIMRNTPQRSWSPDMPEPSIRGLISFTLVNSFLQLPGLPPVSGSSLRHGKTVKMSVLANRPKGWSDEKFVN